MRAVEDTLIAVGMSGGVDSSVTAYLLQKEGYHILGVTFSFFAPCGGMDNSGDARAVADCLGIEHRTADLAEPFREKVIAPFVEAYYKGETPNPCMLCNKGVKFGPEALSSTGAYGFATGHYAQVEKDAGSGRYLLKKGSYLAKDQSYFLAGLSQEQLSRAYFPLGKYRKEEVREIAKEAGLPTAFRSDSQDICFIPDGDYVSFLRENLNIVGGHGCDSGDIVDSSGKKLGEHQGIIAYTVGQRRGLGVSSSGRLYVKGVNPEKKTVVLCDNEGLFSDRLVANRLNFVATSGFSGEISCEAKIRSRQEAVACVAVQTSEDCMEVRFREPQRAITPGQAVVLYEGDVVVASGIIQNVV